MSARTSSPRPLSFHLVVSPPRRTGRRQPAETPPNPVRSPPAPAVRATAGRRDHRLNRIHLPRRPGAIMDRLPTARRRPRPPGHPLDPRRDAPILRRSLPPRPRRLVTAEEMAHLVLRLSLPPLQEEVDPVRQGDPTRLDDTVGDPHRPPGPPPPGSRCSRRHT